MTTVVPAARPAMNGNAGMGGLPVLAEDLLALWETLGYSYERLSTDTAPGNAGRAGFAAHNHAGGGVGSVLCQPLAKWEGRARTDGSSPAFGQPDGICFAMLCPTYVACDASLTIVGRMGTSTQLGAALVPSGNPNLIVEFDAAPLTDVVFSGIRQLGYWTITAKIPAAVNVAGNHYAALRIVNMATGPTSSFEVLAAEVWPVGKVAHGL